MTSPRGTLSRDQRLECRQSDIPLIYTMVQEVGLDTQAGKDDRDLQRKAALKPRPTAAGESRRLELAGVGAWTDANAIGRAR
jgi:hypothetical protein